MENTMNSYSSSVGKRTTGRTLTLALCLGVALIANLGDRAFSASAANSGIDPLEVLDLQIRNNALIVLDSSGSMRDATSYAVAGGNATNFAALELVGDDPRAKLESAKQVLKKIIKNNETKVSFQFGRYEEGNDYSQPGLNSNKFVYTCSTVATPPEVPCTAAAANIAFNFSGFTRALADQHVDRLPAPPAVPGTNATFFALYNDAYRVNRLYRLRSDNTPCVSTDLAIVAGAWTPPPTPSDWNNPNAVGYTGPPFIDIQRFGNNGCTGGSTTARFYFRGGEWNKGNNGGQTCGGFKSLTPLADCTVNSQLSLVAPFVLPEFIPTTTNNASVASLRASTGNAIRASGFTPIAETLIDMRTIFAVDKDLVVAGVQPPLWSTISTQTPVKQRTFVIFLTDGDDTCPSSTTTGGAPINNALRTAHKAQVLRQGIADSGGANIVDPASRVEVFMVAFGGSVSPEINYAAWGGSGMVRPSTGTDDLASTRWSTAPSQTDRNNCLTCRDALPAADTTQLEQALQNAIDVGSATGEFSDQQSVTETVFEYAAEAGADPALPEERYSVSVPVLLQSTFELPDYKGHLNAFRRGDSGTPTDPDDDITVPLWDAGQELMDRVTDATAGMTVGTPYLFAQLHGSATPMNIRDSSIARIKRRVFTTSANGINTNYTASNLVNAAFGDAARNTPSGLTGPSSMWRVSLWPPTAGSSTGQVAPNSDTIAGLLDLAMGFNTMTTLAQVQAAVPGACQGTVVADIPDACKSPTTTANILLRAKREAREIILAYIAGARVFANGVVPIRRNSGPAAELKQLQYVVRPWILAESTLAAPGVVTPPLVAGPVAAVGAVGVVEYKRYRDGLNPTGVPVDHVMNGLGLRNPDKTTNAAAQTTAAKLPDIKPVMSVIYHATNQGLHAFRAGPCPTTIDSAAVIAPYVDCKDGVLAPENGGEELWAFVPYDLLNKLPALVRPQGRANKQYLLASPVRFSDVFVPAPGGVSFGGVSFTGVWRTLLYFGRGQGGKHYTALDVTTPGPFTKHSLNTEPPIVVWNRGNPDSLEPRYAKMGETWSVPAVGFVTAANYGGADFVLFTGSGYSDVVGEGKTFFVLNALNGNVIRAHDVADGSPVAPPVVTPPLPVLTNFLVASPVYYAEDADKKSPSGYRFIGNPISAKVKTVYFPDLHGRIFRFDASNPPSPTATFNSTNAFFEVNAGADGNQPFATALSILQDWPDTAVPPTVLVYAESGHDRRVAIQASKPFKAYAFRDTNGVRSNIFARNFDTGFRGTVQPATAFAGTTLPPTPVVFYAGVKFNPPQPPPPCASRFDSVLVALRGISTVAGVPEEAFDLNATGDDSFITLEGTKINAIRVSGEGNLVIDQGLNAQNAPPPPGVAPPGETTPTSSSLVTLGLAPGSPAYLSLASTTVPYRIGSSVCRTDP